MSSKTRSVLDSFAILYFVRFLHLNNSGVTVTEYNKKKPMRTKRERVKKRLHVLDNVLISSAENHSVCSKGTSLHLSEFLSPKYSTLYVSIAWQWIKMGGKSLCSGKLYIYA